MIFSRIFHVPTQEAANSFDAMCGVKEPGWYFWDETDAYAIGPFATDEMACDGFLKYVEELNTPKPDSG